MERVVNFYARLPRGPAPEPKPTGLLERYGERYFGKNPSAARECDAIQDSSSPFADAVLPTSHLPRDCRSPGPRLRHGLLLPPA